MMEDKNRNMKVMLEMKSNIEELTAGKSNKFETDQLSTLQQVIVKQFKQILIIILELLENDKSASEGGSAGRRNKELISAVTSVANWVMKFDPEKYATD